MASENFSPPARRVKENISNGRNLYCHAGVYVTLWIGLLLVWNLEGKQFQVPTVYGGK
jgi:hypothetical protein